MHVLVTGGAGYIGSHVVRALCARGDEVVVLDNLSTGHAWAVPTGALVRGDLADDADLATAFASGPFDAVMHFAGSIVAPESLQRPLEYYANNTSNSLRLLEWCTRARVRAFIFSSSAAVYGTLEKVPVSEEGPLRPITPYGASKMMTERMITDVAEVVPLRYAVLRYFNVAGADPEGRIGEATRHATHLIKVACEAVLGVRTEVQVFGTDFATPDGTCVRDYVHVEDLASAHIAALDHLMEGGPSVTLNCGYGHGSSVLEVLDAVAQVAGTAPKLQFVGRRAGDPPILVADSTRIAQTLGWTPRYDDLHEIVRTALQWERKYREQGERQELAAGNLAPAKF